MRLDHRVEGRGSVAQQRDAVAARDVGGGDAPEAARERRSRGGGQVADRPLDDESRGLGCVTVLARLYRMRAEYQADRQPRTILSSSRELERLRTSTGRANASSDRSTSGSRMMSPVTKAMFSATRRVVRCRSTRRGRSRSRAEPDVDEDASSRAARGSRALRRPSGGEHGMAARVSHDRSARRMALRRRRTGR